MGLPLPIKPFRKAPFVEELLLQPLQLAAQEKAGLIDQADQRVRRHFAGSSGQTIGVGPV